MKKNIVRSVPALFVVLVLIYSFFVVPLPNFSIVTSGFVEQNVVAGRFLISIPLRGVVENKLILPKMKYISMHKRIELKRKIEAFIKNNEDSDPHLPTGLREIIVCINGKEYISMLYVPDFDLSIYEPAFTYQGAVELMVDLARYDRIKPETDEIARLYDWIDRFEDKGTFSCLEKKQ